MLPNGRQIPVIQPLAPILCIKQTMIRPVQGGKIGWARKGQYSSRAFEKRNASTSVFINLFLTLKHKPEFSFKSIFTIASIQLLLWFFSSECGSSDIRQPRRRGGTLFLADGWGRSHFCSTYLVSCRTCLQFTGTFTMTKICYNYYEYFYCYAITSNRSGISWVLLRHCISLYQTLGECIWSKREGNQDHWRSTCLTVFWLACFFESSL